MSRVKEDASLIEGIIPGEPTQIHRPVIVVHQVSTPSGLKQQYLMHLTELDPMMTDPRVYGIILSDLVDHIAAGYAQNSDRDERDIRELLMRTLKDENRFKEKDPSRGKLIGATLRPKAN